MMRFDGVTRAVVPMKSALWHQRYGTRTDRTQQCSAIVLSFFVPSNLIIPSTLTEIRQLTMTADKLSKQPLNLTETEKCCFHARFLCNQANGLAHLQNELHFLWAFAQISLRSPTCLDQRCYTLLTKDGPGFCTSFKFTKLTQKSRRHENPAFLL